MADDDLQVRASLDDDLTRPLHRVKGAVKDVGDEVERSDKRARRFTGTLRSVASGGGKLAKVLGVGLVSAVAAGVTALGAAGVGAVVLGGRLVNLASDAEETASKFATVFGRQADAVDKWVKRTNAAYGITTKDLQDVTSRFGVFGKAAGIANKDLPEFSTSLAQAGLDLSSFYNVDPEEAFLALSSGLTGEAEPLRRFGIFLSDAAMKAEAATMGLNGELTESQKVMVRQRLILKGLGDADGDLARTKDSLANKTRALKGRFVELGTQLGKVLVPVVGKAVGWLDGKLSPIVTRLTDQAGPMADALGGKRWDEVVLRLDNVTGAGGRLWSKFDRVRDVVEGVKAGWDAFGTVGAIRMFDSTTDSGGKVAEVLEKLLDVGRDLKTLYTDALQPAIANLGPVGLAILSPLSLLDNVISFLADHASALVPILTVAAGAFAAWKAVRFVADGISAAAAAARTGREALSTIGKAVTGTKDLFVKAAGPMRRFFAPGGGSDGLRLRLMAVREQAGKAGGALKRAATSAGSWAKAGARSAGAWAKARLADVASKAKAAGSALKSGATSAARWAASGARAALTWARATAATVANKVATLASSAAQKAAAVAQWALNAAMNANPVMLIVLGIGALVAALVLAYNKVGWFRAAVDAAFRFIGRAVAWVVEFIKSHWELMLAAILGPFGIAIALIVHHWDKVKAAVGWVVDKVVELWQRSEPARELLARLGSIGLEVLKDAIGWVILKVVDLWTQAEPARKLLGTIGSITLSVLKDAIGWVVDKVKWIIDNAGKVGDVLGGIGGAIGSVIPGDTPHPRATSHRVAAAGRPHAGGRGARRAGANLAHTLAVHRAVDAATPGRRRITSSLRGFALGSPSSDHGTGRALDIQGSGLNAYARNLEAIGGFAEHHGSGGGRHLHAAIGDTAHPRATSVDAGGGTLIVLEAGAIVVDRPASTVELADAIRTGIRDYAREREERGA